MCLKLDFKECNTFFSDEKKMMWQLCTLLFRHLCQKLKKVLYFTDGCAGQYKNRNKLNFFVSQLSKIKIFLSFFPLHLKGDNNLMFHEKYIHFINSLATKISSCLPIIRYATLKCYHKEKTQKPQANRTENQMRKKHWT